MADSRDELMLELSEKWSPLLDGELSSDERARLEDFIANDQDAQDFIHAQRRFQNDIGEALRAKTPEKMPSEISLSLACLLDNSKEATAVDSVAVRNLEYIAGGASSPVSPTALPNERVFSLPLKVAVAATILIGLGVLAFVGIDWSDSTPNPSAEDGLLFASRDNVMPMYKELAATGDKLVRQLRSEPSGDLQLKHEVPNATLKAMGCELSVALAQPITFDGMSVDAIVYCSGGKTLTKDSSLAVTKIGALELARVVLFMIDGNAVPADAQKAADGSWSFENKSYTAVVRYDETRNVTLFLWSGAGTRAADAHEIATPLLISLK